MHRRTVRLSMPPPDALVRSCAAQLPVARREMDIPLCVPIRRFAMGLEVALLRYRQRSPRKMLSMVSDGSRPSLH